VSPPLSAVLAAAATALVVWLWARSRTAALAARQHALEEQLAKAEADLKAMRLERDDLKTQVGRLETGLKAERDALEMAQTKLTDTFKALASDALRSNNDEFLKRAGEALVKPVAESLKDVRDKVSELEKARSQAYGSLSKQLESLALAQASMQTETTKLSTALSTTKTAGTWGELQLRRVVELAGMVEHCDFTEQESAGGQRPDLIVHLPRGQQIVVDAKAPTDAYREAASTSDPKVRAAKLAEHAAKVRGHVDALSAKAYWEQFQPSPEFVVLFLPGDQFLAAALEADPALLDRAIRSRVLPVTPSTLVALLKAAAYGWRQESVSKNAEEISELGRLLSDRIATYVEHFEKVGRGLEAATRSYNAAVGSLESMVLPGARKFAELGAKGAKELPAIEPVETAVRDLTKRG
jgi:DNA recombination protein RmuC